MRAEADKVAAIRARVATLTPRELEVMRCVIGGASNKIVAETLGIAEKTVKIHRGRVMTKVGVGSAAELLLACQRVDIEPQRSRDGRFPDGLGRPDPAARIGLWPCMH